MTGLALVKALLLLGAVLLIGGGITAFGIAPELTKADRSLRRHILWGGVLGAALLLLGSAFDIFLTLVAVLGRLPGLELVYSYLTTTRHGTATLYRGGLVVCVLGLTVLLGRRSANPQGRASGTVLKGVYLALSLGVLGTFSYSSHAAATGGTVPLFADLMHFATATVWAGPLFYLAFVPDWQGPSTAGLQTAFKRVSLAGLLSVLGLFITGGYTTLIHLQDPARFATSAYGYVLYAKLFLVLLIVGLAGLNRFWLLPAFLRNATPDFTTRFKRVVRLEGVLLTLVFLVTGLLTTSALPHGEGHTGAWSNLIHLIQTLRGD